MTPLFDISNICAGIILGSPVLNQINALNGKIGPLFIWLNKFRLYFGCISFFLGIYYIFRSGYLIHDIAGICAGILLLNEHAAKVPEIGHYATKVCSAMGPFEKVIGIVALVVGIFGFLNINILA